MLYDHREERSGIPAALEAAGVEMRPEQLPAGDYIVSERLVVERKTGADLAASVTDRRLFEQIDRLSASFEAVVLLIEGEPVHMAPSSWQGALARALTSGASVLRTHDPGDSARWLERFHRLEGKPPSEVRARPNPRRPTADLADVAEDVLRCMPGVSSVGARRLLAHFGSLKAVVAADERELREVAGIGPVRGAALAPAVRTARRTLKLLGLVPLSCRPAERTYVRSGQQSTSARARRLARHRSAKEAAHAVRADPAATAAVDAADDRSAELAALAARAAGAESGRKSSHSGIPDALATPNRRRRHAQVLSQP